MATTRDWDGASLNHPSLRFVLWILAATRPLCLTVACAAVQIKVEDGAKPLLAAEEEHM